jgi:hypothetical protein
MSWRGVAIASLAWLGSGCGAPSLGEMPVLCGQGNTCPTGYSCVHGSCALPGTVVPTTIVEEPFLHGYDLRIVAQDTTALVTWQTYPYSIEGERILGARLNANGDASERMTLLSGFESDPGLVEPYYDLLPTGKNALLIAMSASPLPDDMDQRPRLIPYAVTLPPEGSEATAVHFQPAWDAEERLETVGYGAVSKPRLLARKDHVELGYFRSRTDTTGMTNATLGELAIYSVDAMGAKMGDPLIVPARAKQSLPVAIGVVDAFAADDVAWWALDDARPSVLRIPDGFDPTKQPTVEARLDGVGVAVQASRDELTYLRPSDRTGQKLPSDPVDGPSALRKVQLTAGAPKDSSIAAIPSVRDFPRPVWIARTGKPAILISPGPDVASPTLSVDTIDAETGDLKHVASVARLSSLELLAVVGTATAGHLFVCWADQEDSVVAVRCAVLAEP